MKATDMLNKVQELVGVEASEETQEVKLAQATLENGTVIESEDFAIGSEVFIVTDDEKVALPVGAYSLEDGEQLKVEEEGIIAAIGKPEEAPAEGASKEVGKTQSPIQPKFVVGANQPGRPDPGFYIPNSASERIYSWCEQGKLRGDVPVEFPTIGEEKGQGDFPNRSNKTNHGSGCNRY